MLYRMIMYIKCRQAWNKQMTKTFFKANPPSATKWWTDSKKGILFLLLSSISSFSRRNSLISPYVGNPSSILNPNRRQLTFLCMSICHKKTLHESLRAMWLMITKAGLTCAWLILLLLLLLTPLRRLSATKGKCRCHVLSRANKSAISTML